VVQPSGMLYYYHIADGEFVRVLSSQQLVQVAA
jgi:hypothetical protein